MSHFVYDNTALSYPKTNLNVLPPGANAAQYVVDNDWNIAMQACVDLRDVLKNGKYYGFQEQPSDPLPAGVTDYLWMDSTGALNVKKGVSAWKLVQSTRQVIAGTGLSGGGDLSADRTLALETLSPDPSGTYTRATVTIDSHGRVTAATPNTPSSAYDTLLNTTVAVTQRTQLYVDGAFLVFSDDGGVSRTALNFGGTIGYAGKITLDVTGGSGGTPMYSMTATSPSAAGYTGFLSVTPPAITGATAAEWFDLNFAPQGSLQFTTGATIAAQRGVRFNPRTYTATAATQTLTYAAAVSIAGPPVAGTNVTITNTYPLLVESGHVAIYGDGITIWNQTPGEALSQIWFDTKGQSESHVIPGLDPAHDLNGAKIGIHYMPGAVGDVPGTLGMFMWNREGSRIYWANSNIATMQLLWGEDAQAHLTPFDVDDGASGSGDGKLNIGRYTDAGVSGAGYTRHLRLNNVVLKGNVKWGAGSIASSSAMLGGNGTAIEVKTADNSLFATLKAAYANFDASGNTSVTSVGSFKGGTPTTSAEYNHFIVDPSATTTYSASVTNSRAVVFKAPVYDGSAAGKHVTGVAATVAIEGAPTAASGNLTLDNSACALWVQSGRVQIDGAQFVSSSPTVAFMTNSTLTFDIRSIGNLAVRFVNNGICWFPGDTGILTTLQSQYFLPDQYAQDPQVASGGNTSKGFSFGAGRDAGATFRSQTLYGTTLDSYHAKFLASNGTTSAAKFANVHIQSVIANTSSGYSASLAITSKTNTTSGGAIYLIDAGVTTTDYFTGYTSKFSVDYTGKALFAGVVSDANQTQGNGTVQTTDATTTTIASFTPPDNSVVQVRARISARKSDGTLGSGTVLVATFRIASGSVTQLGSTAALTTGQNDAGASSWTFTLDTNGTIVRIRGTGAVATTVNWTTQYDYTTAT